MTKPKQTNATKGPLDYPAFCLAMQEERSRHKRRCESLEVRLKEFQMTCNHEITEFHFDPSGGCDSSRDCVRCNKTL